MGCAFLFAPQASTQIVQLEDEKLVAGDDDPGDRFGTSVDSRGSMAVFGAPRADGTGAAYIFADVSGVWTEISKLVALDAGADDEFGIAVSIDDVGSSRGPVAVIGAKRDDDAAFDAGAVYVFRRTLGVWAEEQKIVAGDGAQLDQFGASVAVAGDTLIVGAPNDDDDGSGSGSVYVYRDNGASWTLEQKLTSNDASGGDNFGLSISLGEGVCVIGSPGDDAIFIDAGSAYVFRRALSFWTQEDKVTPSDPGLGDLFGRAVAISNDLVLVGASHDDDLGPQTGSAYAFRNTAGTWNQEHKYVSSDLASGDNFGFSVAVCGELAVIGSVGHDDAGNGSGSAYAFVRDTGVWGEVAKLNASDAATADEFGGDVSVSGELVMVAARLDDDGGGESGAVYRYEVEAGDAWTDLGNALAGTHGAPVLAGTGVLCGGDSMSIDLTNALENTTAALIVGFSTLNAPFKGGIFVPSPDLLVAGLPTGPSGALSIPATFPLGVPSGFSLYLQYWITDAAGPVGFAASNGLQGTTP